ncbi:MAG: hypothetical protein FJ276_03825 [Planctomycetes bacterium]|nr:hypothetical protein [Planctomycetota bacterium]
MADDEIRVIRQVRHEISAEFGHDVDRVVDYYRSVEERLKQSGPYRFAPSAAPPELVQDQIVR